MKSSFGYRLFTGFLCTGLVGALTMTALADKPGAEAQLGSAGPKVQKKLGGQLKPLDQTPTNQAPFTTPTMRDDCTQAVATAIGAVVNGDTTGAAPDNPVLCGSFAGANAPSNWYRFTGDGTTVTVTACGSAYDTTLHSYCGACPASLVCITGNDDSQCGANFTLQSTISWCTEAGVEYYVRIAGFGGSSGAYTIAITSDGIPCAGAPNCSPPPPIPNDTCALASTLTLPGSVSATTVGATPDTPDAPLCGTFAGANSPTVWYTFTGNGQTVTASLCGSSYDTTIHAYCGDNCSTLFCAAGNDDFCGLQSQISFCTEAGRQYWLRIGGFGGQSGAFTLSLTADGIPCNTPALCAPCDIECDTPTIIEVEPDCGIPTDTVNGGCNSVPPISITVNCGDRVSGTGAFDTGIGFRDTDWYDITIPPGPGQTDVTITVNAEFDSLIGFVGYPCPQGTFLSFATSTPCTPVSLTRCLAPGTYYIFVAPQFLGAVPCAGPGNEYCLDIACAPGNCPPPANDECSGAFPVTCGSTGTYTNENATVAVDDPIANCAFGGPQVGGATVWFSFVATAPNACVDLCGGGILDDSIVTIYSGTCGSLTEIGCNDDACGLLSTATAGGLTTGQTYYIRVAAYVGFGATPGTFTLSVNCFSDCTAQQPGDLVENEPDCGLIDTDGDGLPNDTVNGGCNSVPPIYSPIQCGDTYYGSAGTDDFAGFRDTDWYELTLTNPTQIIWRASAAFPIRLFIVTPQPDCTAFSIMGPFDASCCNEASSGIVSLAPGTYWLFAAPQGFAGVPCQSFYRATLDCVATGACCFSNGSCQVLQPGECATAGGSYQGDNTSCNVTPGGNTVDFSSNPNLPIPDAFAPGVSDTINVAPNFVVGKVTVDVNIPDHTFINDLHIRLTNGLTSVDLWDGQCGGEDGLTVTFDDAGAPVVCAQPTTGTITPLQALSTLNGRLSGGAWTLTAADEVGLDVGTLVSWGLHLTDGVVTNCGCTCVGDANSDGIVDISDLAIVLSRFGTSGPFGNVCVDYNNDNVCDITDLALHLSRFGTTCP